MRKDEKAITLISLIITVIILTILATLVIDIAIKGETIEGAENASKTTSGEIAEGQLLLNQILTDRDNMEITQCEHLWGEWEIIKEATSSEAGEQKRTCSLCGAEQTQTVPMVACTEHTYGSWTVTTAATCAATGSQTRTCSVCNATETQTIAKTSTHTYGSWTVTTAATCAATGTRTKTCSVCGATTSETIAKLTTHTYGSWTVTTAATCTTAGSRTRSCTVCGTTQTNTIAATGHTWGNCAEKEESAGMWDGVELSYTWHYSICSSCGLERDFYTPLGYWSHECDICGITISCTNYIEDTGVEFCVLCGQSKEPRYINIWVVNCSRFL